MKKLEIEIIYQDSNLLVINKPSGLSVTHDRKDEELLPVIAKQLGEEEKGKLLLIHRLDKDTSGVMLLARNTDTQRTFSGYFAKNQMKKTYLAIVRGGVTQEHGTIDAPIGPDHKDERLMRIDQSKKGKQARTDWHLLADFGGAALLAVNPLTGRTHQIRVHMPASGMPLAVDPLYGRDEDEGLMLSEFKPNYHIAKFHEEKPLIDRLTLHAYQIQLPENAMAGIPNIFVAKLDKKFAAAVKMLAKHNIRGHKAFVDESVLEKIIASEPILI